MAQIYGQLESAQFENRTSDYSATASGRFWFRTDTLVAKIANGSDVRQFLINDGNAIIGNNGTANNNIRFHRGAAGVLQFVAGGDSTAEGTLSTSLNQISFRAENYTTGARPAFGNAGRFIWNTTTGSFQGDTGSAWIDASVGTNTVLDVNLRQSAGLSVIGRSANSTGNVADITAANDYDILRRNGTSLSFGKLVNKVRAISSADSIVYTDDIIEVSAGSNYNLGVTTTSMIAGQVFKIRRTDNAPTFAVTLNFTINGPLGSGVSYKLHTRGEEYELKYNGTDFDLLNHYTNTGLMGTATVTLTAGTSGTFTLGTTTAKTVDGYRRGRHLVVQLDIRQTSAGSNGTGPCLFTIPYSLTADTTAGGPAYTGTDASVAITSRIVGAMYGGSSGGASNIIARAYLYDSTKFGMVGTIGGVLGIFGSALFGLTNATTNINGEIWIPISGWTD